MLANTPNLQLPQWESTDDLDYAQVNAALASIDAKAAPSAFSTALRPTGTERYDGRIIYDTDLNQYLIWNTIAAAWIPYGGVKPWIAFVPTLHSDMGGTEAAAVGTNQSGWYQVIGKTCFAQATGQFTNLTVNAGISLPLTAKNRILNIGTNTLFGSGTPADQSGTAYMNVAKNKLVVVGYTQGFRDAAALNVMRYSVQYELP